MGKAGRHPAPHDAQIFEKRGVDVSDEGHGYFPGGVYVYEKTFIAPAEWKDKYILAEFEGVYKNSVISLNGREIGSHVSVTDGIWWYLLYLVRGIFDVSILK